MTPTGNGRVELDAFASAMREEIGGLARGFGLSRRSAREWSGVREGLVCSWQLERRPSRPGLGAQARWGFPWSTSRTGVLRLRPKSSIDLPNWRLFQESLTDGECKWVHGAMKFSAMTPHVIGRLT